MKKVTLSDIQHFFHTIILPFHDIERDMPLPSNLSRNDNNAEHSWSLAFMAACLAPHASQKLDVSKCVYYAVIHDITEVYEGDISFMDERSHTHDKKEQEARALKRLDKDLQKYPWVIDALHSYEKRTEPEANFVYALDKFLNFLMIVEGKEYYYVKKHKMKRSSFEHRLDEHLQKASADPSVLQWYMELRAILDDHPEYFYQG